MNAPAFNQWLTGATKVLRQSCAIASTESLRLLRDRVSLSLIVTVPLFQIILFGWAIQLEPRNITVAISRGNNASADDGVRQSLTNSGTFLVVADHLPAQQAIQWVTQRRAQIALELSDYRMPALIADASDSFAVHSAALVLHNRLQDAMSLSPLNLGELRTAWLYNPENKTSWLIIPGLVGVVVMISMLMLGAITLVRDREQGSLEGLLATPLSTTALIMGKLFPYLVISGAQSASLIWLAHAGFGIPLVNGTFPLLICTLLLSLAHLMLGLAISALATTQMQAMQMAVVFYLPSMLLSGFMFPFASMPDWAQRLGELLPLTHYVRIARGLMLRGAEGTAVFSELKFIWIFLVVVSIVASFCFKRRFNANVEN